MARACTPRGGPGGLAASASALQHKAARAVWHSESCNAKCQGRVPAQTRPDFAHFVMGSSSRLLAPLEPCPPSVHAVAQLWQAFDGIQPLHHTHILPPTGCGSTGNLLLALRSIHHHTAGQRNVKDVQEPCRGGSQREVLMSRPLGRESFARPRRDVCQQRQRSKAVQSPRHRRLQHGPHRRGRPDPL